MAERRSQAGGRLSILPARRRSATGHESVGDQSVAALPLAARAQQPAMPAIGYVSSRSSESDVAMLAAFRRGLNEAGYVEKRNLTIEYRFADGRPQVWPRPSRVSQSSRSCQPEARA
jgi:hypothetical protein